MGEPALFGDHVRQWRTGRAPFDLPRLVVEPLQRGEPIVLTELRLLHRRLHDPDRLVIDLERHGERMTVLAAMRENKELPMDIYDREDQTKIASGKLLTLDNQINASTGTLRLRGICSNEDESLFPNQFVNVHLLVNTLRDVTLLPNSAIQRNSESAYVYLVKQPENGQTNTTVQIQTITTGATDATNSVVEGISPGDIIAGDNFNRLSDGTKVILRPAAGQEPGQGQHKSHHQQDSQ